MDVLASRARGCALRAAMRAGVATATVRRPALRGHDVLRALLFFLHMNEGREPPFSLPSLQAS